MVAFGQGANAIGQFENLIFERLDLKGI